MQFDSSAMQSLTGSSSRRQGDVITVEDNVTRINIFIFRLLSKKGTMQYHDEEKIQCTPPGHDTLPEKLYSLNRGGEK